jgi:hypothetical protein
MLYEASPGVFLVPEEGGFAEQLAVYIKKVNNQLDKFQ